MNTVERLRVAHAIAFHRFLAIGRDPDLRGSVNHERWVAIMQSLETAQRAFGTFRPSIVRALAGGAAPTSIKIPELDDSHVPPEVACLNLLKPIRDPDGALGFTWLSIRDAINVLERMQPQPIPVAPVAVPVTTPVPVIPWGYGNAGGRK